MKTFTTQAEIYQALLDGKKITCLPWMRHNKKAYVHLKNGILVNGNDAVACADFYVVSNWRLYEEPKTPVVRWLWSYPIIDNYPSQNVPTTQRIVTGRLFTEDEFKNYIKYSSGLFNASMKLEWSRTEFPEE